MCGTSGEGREAQDLCPALAGADIAEHARFKENTAVELCHAILAAPRQRAINLATKQFEHPMHPIFASAGDAPKVGPADHHGASASRQRLHNVDAAPKTAIDQHPDFVAHGIKDCGQRAA